MVKTNQSKYLKLNSTLPDDRRVKFFGIDFNRPRSYFKALKKIIPNKPSPENIRGSIELIKSASESLRDCSYIIDFNANLKKNLTTNKPDYVSYLGKSYNDFERIVMSKGTCNDVYKNTAGCSIIKQGLIAVQAQQAIELHLGEGADDTK